MARDMVGVHELAREVPIDSKIGAEDFIKFYSRLRIRVKCYLEDECELGPEIVNQVGTMFSEEVTKVNDKFA